MKSTERHHLKDNELAHSLAQAREFVEPRRRQVTGIAIALAVIVAGYIGYTVINQRSQTQGQDLLADAMVALNAEVVPAGAKTSEGVPAAATLGATGTFSTEAEKLNAALPKLKAASDAYPKSDAGIQARYHMAGALAALGRYDEAVTHFNQVAEYAGSDSLYGRMARLGKADALARGNKLDDAIAEWKTLTSQDSDELPVDAILMEIARAYVQKGNTEEARKAFSEIVDKHPDSPYSVEAREELDNLKG